MDLYQKKSNWKVILGLVGLIILIITMVYSNYLANQLAINEKNNVELFAKALMSLNQDGDISADKSFEIEFLELVNNIPIILESENGTLEGYEGEDVISDQEELQSRKERILKSGYEPIEGKGYSRYIYYQNSRLYTLITYFPLVQVLLIAFFIAIGYYLFSTSRKAEQNRVWAGMAKETAHQLGTPISAIMAWIEHLKISEGVSEEQLEIIDELNNDVNRLELIADRFSKIGSAPKLDRIKINEEIDDCIIYMKRRASKRISFSLDSDSDDREVMINRHLFDWVIENLYRNALDAMGAEGSLKTKIYENNEYVCIDIQDSGKGIPSSNFKNVFEPGFSTKQRGWGLGLSLAKRIIENYHSGKIFVKSSKANEGTTFTVQLPKA